MENSFQDKIRMTSSRFTNFVRKEGVMMTFTPRVLQLALLLSLSVSVFHVSTEAGWFDDWDEFIPGVPDIIFEANNNDLILSENSRAQCFLKAAECLYTSYGAAASCAAVIAGTAGVGTAWGCKDILTGEGGNICAEANERCGIERQPYSEATILIGSVTNTDTTLLTCPGSSRVESIIPYTGTQNPNANSDRQLAGLWVRCSNGSYQSYWNWPNNYQSSVAPGTFMFSCANAWDDAPYISAGISAHLEADGDGLASIQLECDNVIERGNEGFYDATGIDLDNRFGPVNGVQTTDFKRGHCPEGLSLRAINVHHSQIGDPASNRFIKGIEGICSL